MVLMRHICKYSCIYHKISPVLYAQSRQRIQRTVMFETREEYDRFRVAGQEIEKGRGRGDEKKKGSSGIMENLKAEGLRLL